MKPDLYKYDLGDDVTVFSSTRRGGVSKGRYGEFNINEFCGDEADDILRNRSLLATELGIDTDRLVIPHQVHKTEIRLITEDFFSLPSPIRKRVIDGVDGVMTAGRGICIGVSTADCIPVLLYDARNRAAAAVHAGWRGTVERIASKAVEEMKTVFNTAPQDLKAVIGPGISLESFEVGAEVYDTFANHGFNMTDIAKRYPAMTGDSEKWHIDLWECNKQQLTDAGIKKENIQIAGICTYKHSDVFFSARRMTINSGRIYTAIMLR